VDPELFRQGPGVDPRDARDAALPEPVVERLARRGVRGPDAELRDDIAGDLRPLRLETVRVDAVVADEGIGLAEDLAAVGRIGDALRVADDPGIENDFPPRFGGRAETYAFEDGDVRAGQRCSEKDVSIRSIFGAV